MGRLVVEVAVFDGGGMEPFEEGGARVTLLPLVEVVAVLSLSRCLFVVRLDPNDWPNCFLNRAAFMGNRGRLHSGLRRREDYFIADRCPGRDRGGRVWWVEKPHTSSGFV